jgi:hypothetical protein
MRYPASEKLEIIKLVEQSHLPARRTLEQLGIPRRTFCRWYDRLTVPTENTVGVRYCRHCSSRIDTRGIECPLSGAVV